jgi:hypothetical protein
MTRVEEDPVLAVLDAHIRTQLAKAVEVYASHVDLDARLQVILEAGTGIDQADDTDVGQV